MPPDSLVSSPAWGSDPTASPILQSFGPDGDLPVGTTAKVAGTDGVGLAVRVQASVGSDMLAVLPDGSSVEVLTAPQTAEGELWYQVRYGPQGTAGWAHGEFLVASFAV